MKVMRITNIFVLVCILMFAFKQVTGASFENDTVEKIRKLSTLMSTSVEEMEHHLIDAALENNLELEAMVAEFYEEVVNSGALDNQSQIARTKRSTPSGKSGYLLPPASLGNAYFIQAVSSGWSHGHVGFFGDSDTIIEAPGGGKLSRKISRKESGLVVNLYDSYLEFVGSIDAKRGALRGAERLVDLPYNSSMNNKKCWDGVVNCSQLVWCAYQWPGYDVDSNGGKFVSPKDILNSSYFERTRY